MRACFLFGCKCSIIHPPSPLCGETLHFLGWNQCSQNTLIPERDNDDRNTFSNCGWENLVGYAMKFFPCTIEYPSGSVDWVEGFIQFKKTVVHGVPKARIFDGIPSNFLANGSECLSETRFIFVSIVPYGENHPLLRFFCTPPFLVREIIYPNDRRIGFCNDSDC